MVGSVIGAFGMIGGHLWGDRYLKATFDLVRGLEDAESRLQHPAGTIKLSDSSSDDA